MSDGLSDGDRAWLETRFRSLEDKIEKRDATVNDLKIDVGLLKDPKGHRCTEAIEKHEASSWSHNPYKAGGLLVSIIGALEGIKRVFSGH